MIDNQLPISEDFYSIQCEGITTGKPAYFIRLKGCNLQCGASAAFIKEVQKAGKGNTVSGSFQGDLHTEGKATWTCDSIPVWLFGEKKPFNYLTDKWKEIKVNDKESLHDWILKRVVHLIWTGGEPTIHQEKIVQFVENFMQENLTLPYSELETNGTIELSEGFSDVMTQINCSPKLTNSGMKTAKRINPKAIESIKNHWNSWFKFVIDKEEDIHEFVKDYCEPFNIDMTQVVCMPALDSRENFHERTHFVLEMAKKYGFHGLTRLHISAWGNTCGV